ncbi:MAG: PP2C family protein-serine/threonine phosphatase [Bacteroidota bacterium]
MSTQTQYSEPRLRDTLRNDFSQGGYWNTFRKEFRSLKEFYIDQEKKKRLEAMPQLKRWLYLNGWLLKSMLMKLNPFRRIVLVLGIILLVWSPVVIMTNKHVEITDFHLIGGAVILLVLMLELKDKLLAKDELVAGKRVQQALMPAQSPSVQGWSLWIYSRPANEVGGDLIDFLRQSENRFGVALADVSGKGLQAALIMAKLQATLKALAPDYDSIGKLITKLNAIVHRDGLPNSFASLVYAEVSSNSGTVRFVNAGHLPPIVLAASGLQEMQKGGAALGLMGSTVYEERQLELQSGDVFLVYSDGLTEASNERGEFFGSERLLKRLPLLRNRSPEEIGKALLGEIDFFVNDAPPNDDISLVILKRL